MGNDICIYTVLVGSYDNVIDPLVINSKVDYICFVGKGESERHDSRIWRFEEFDNKTINDNGRISRIPKILPHTTVLNQYSYSLYIDANIIIKGQYIYDRINELISRDIKIALLQHPFRDCVYQEAYVCIASLKGGWLDILRQICFLKLKRFPKHGGLYEANVIFRKHNETEVIMMDELWWKSFMKYSKRDQLSLVYALKESSLHTDYFLQPGYTTRNHHAFEKVTHLTQKHSKKMLIKKYFVSLISGLSRKLLKE